MDWPPFVAKNRRLAPGLLFLPKEVKDSIMELPEINDVDLQLVWDPPWDKSMMSEAAKLELNL